MAEDKGLILTFANFEDEDGLECFDTLVKPSSELLSGINSAAGGTEEDRGEDDVLTGEEEGDHSAIGSC